MNLLLGSCVVRKGLLVIATSLVMLVVLCSVAFAYTGSFSWTASFAHELRSRDYCTPNTGTYKITCYISNNGDPYTNVYSIQLWRNRTLLPDVSYNIYYNTCGVSVSRYWSIQDSGTFYFKLAKPQDGYTFSGNGTTYYP